ncbi:MAG: DUF1553 domain-containing protein, partial [Planctomycetaceae bacterium]
MKYLRRIEAWLAAVVLLSGSVTTCWAAEAMILPQQVTLEGPAASQVLVVQQVEGANFRQQLTGIEWSSADPQVATVSRDGVVTPVADGETAVLGQSQGQSFRVPVRVQGARQQQQWSFRNDVLPVLSKAGCNMGACHGALAGKGGFRLSLRGYDPPTDHANIVFQDRGRRVEFSEPARSLLIAKPTGAIPHKGGVRFETDSPSYRILSEWIAAGAPEPQTDDPRVEELEILPNVSLHRVGETQQMIVTAVFSDGSRRDVTPWVKWSSANEAVCRVDESGLVTVIGPGEGAVVAWYSSQIAIARITVPWSDALPDGYEFAAPKNFVDEQIDRKLALLGIPASATCTDQTFVRRVYLDTIGKLPTSDEAARFLTDTAADKRDQLIDALLARPEFVDYWTYKWSDVLMLNGTLLRPEALRAYYSWMRKHVEVNTPWDAVVREIMTATGDSFENGATNFYALYQSPEDMTENACQAFLGLSIGCAKCHNHPLEKWTNDQYYGMANLFARVKAKGWGGEARNGNGRRTVYVSTSGDLVQPRTGKPQPPTPLDGESLPIDDPGDRRQALAKWLTSPENPYFARSISNRIWANFFSVGLVMNIDDLRASNPASNEDLLSACAAHLIENKFDLKSLMRVILQSNAYQRSSEPRPENVADTRFYSRYYPRRLMAEVLHDAVADVTRVPTEFTQIAFPGSDFQKTNFYPVGTRAIQLYDSAVDNYFLQSFGRNQRRIVCECERSDVPSMVQVLHLSNGKTINDKLKAPASSVSEWLALRRAGMSDVALLDQLYLAGLSRFPTEAERQSLLAQFPAVGSTTER